MTDQPTRRHKLGLSYVLPAASSAAFALGAKVHEEWTAFLAKVEAIPGIGKIEITDIVVRPTGPKTRTGLAAGEPSALIADKADMAPLATSAALQAIGPATALTSVPEPVPEPLAADPPAPIHEAAHGEPKRAAA